MKRSVFNNVAYGLKLRGNGGNIAAKVHKALELVGLSSDDFAQRPWYALSGGEAQRVALAARLALEPKVLLLDEPTASVDAASAQLIKEASLRARRELGTTLVVASHDWQWLYEVCDEILHLFRGRIFGTGRESIIFGPWQELTAGKWGKMLSDNQALYVSRPPDQTAVAVISELSICETETTASDENVILQGLISRLSLERKSGQLSMTVLVGDLPFTVRLPSGFNPEHTLFPGKKINIQYRLDGVKWI